MMPNISTLTTAPALNQQDLLSPLNHVMKIFHTKPTTQILAKSLRQKRYQSLTKKLQHQTKFQYSPLQNNRSSPIFFLYSNSENSKLKYIPHIDQIRGLAITLVFFYHLQFPRRSEARMASTSGICTRYLLSNPSTS